MFENFTMQFHNGIVYLYFTHLKRRVHKKSNNFGNTAFSLLNSKKGTGNLDDGRDCGKGEQ